MNEDLMNDTLRKDYDLLLSLAKAHPALSVYVKDNNGFHVVIIFNPGKVPGLGPNRAPAARFGFSLCDSIECELLNFSAMPIGSPGHYGFRVGDPVFASTMKQVIDGVANAAVPNIFYFRSPKTFT